MAPPDMIAMLRLTPHPEGGWYRETWRAPERVRVLRRGVAVERAAATSILFLLQRGERSRFHRIGADEHWAWQGGAAFAIHVLGEGGALDTICLGPPESPGCVPQAVVPAGRWFAAEPASDAEYALAACVVAPGFEFSEFELAERAPLEDAWPAHRALVRRFTPEPAAR